MTSKERMLTALRREKPDRVPATVHQWQAYHLNTYLDGVDPLAAFQRFGLDAAITVFPVTERLARDVDIKVDRSTNAEGNEVRRSTITTPDGVLTKVVEQNPITSWTTEHLVKNPEDVDLIDKYLEPPLLDKETVAQEYDRIGDAGIVRGFVWGDQGGCWQHACNLYGLENMIMATFDDPQWVHHFLKVLQKKKLRFVEESLAGAKYDLIETGGGASSSTCISPELHREFCLPYDREHHDALHAIGLPAVYHTCGGMMAILDLVVENNCDASETLTPAGMGGDARHVELKERIGDKVCLIGGLNQFQILDCGTREQIREEVFRLFRELGPGGGYMMSPSDHFFETPPENLAIYGEAARECTY